MVDWMRLHPFLFLLIAVVLAGGIVTVTMVLAGRGD